MSDLLNKTLAAITPVNEAAAQAAQERLDGLLKPPGSLGKLEEIAVRLAGIYGEPLPRPRPKAIIMMAADNGVYEEGYHGYPQDVTRLLAELSGDGLTGVAVLAKQADSRLVVVDIGLKGKTAGAYIWPRKIRPGTANIARGPAMHKEEALRAVEVGIETVYALAAEGIGVFGTGEAGLCNTTTSAAVLCALTGERPEQIVGRGTGQDDASFGLKLEAVKKSLEINQPNSKDALDVLAKVGGLDIAGLAGCYLAAAALKKPIVIDGFIAGVAALAAIALHPVSAQYMLPSHLSAEKGARIVCDYLRMEPLLYLQMCLGEGTGAALAFHLVDAACLIINEMGLLADLSK
ncbi:MAG: nicotinate-nucleotide--dimethylbenzimidazole phosphoribosyltransferase [Clostridia bacterium]|nr:nicotinate-nucleotide--dimethylbenzimidazole phosphoribosyltransferase [Clostridia bacterium]